MNPDRRGMEQQQAVEPQIIIQGGIGDPPDEVLLASMGRITSSSQMATWLDCEMKGKVMPFWDDVRPGGVARHLGLMWHEYQEKRFTRGEESDEEKKAAGIKAANQKFQQIIDKADELNFDKFTTDLTGWRDWWFNQAVEHFENTEASGHTGSVLAVEVPFWLVVQCHPSGRVDFPPFVVVGTLDQIRRESDYLRLGEWKTIDEKEVLSEWIEHRELTPQHNTYQTVLSFLCQAINDLSVKNIQGETAIPGMQFWPHRNGGIRYLFVRRAKFPQKASAAGTVEERAKQWAETLFDTDVSPYGNVAHEGRMVAVAAAMFDSFTSKYGLQRNVNACKHWGSKCPLWDFCHSDVPLNMLAHLIPNEDYRLKSIVDRASMLIQEAIARSKPNLH